MNKKIIVMMTIIISTEGKKPDNLHIRRDMMVKMIMEDTLNL
jgi:hypothetical protein